jgi:phenylalanyl-tRNA synthetase alpha chain
MGAAYLSFSSSIACLYTVQDIDHFRWVLTEEAQGYLQHGSPEAQVFNAVPSEGLPMAQLKVQLL